MPRLANIRHERFVRHFLKTGVASRAYTAAGYSNRSRNGLDASASRLLRHAKVQSRISEFRCQMTQKTKYSLETLLEHLAEDRRFAYATGQPSAAITATMGLAKLCGLLIDRKEQGGPGDFSALQSVDEIVAKVRAELGENAANLIASAVDKPDVVDDIPEPTQGLLN